MAITKVKQKNDVSEIRGLVDETKVQLIDAHKTDPADLLDPNNPGNFPNETILRALRMEEDGDAYLFTEIYRDRFVYDHAAGRWYEFDGNLWIEDRADRALVAVENLIYVFGSEARRQSLMKLGVQQEGNEDEAKHDGKIEDALLKRIRLLRNIRRKINVLKLAAADWEFVNRTSIALTGDEWDADPWIMGCKNGVIDLRTGDFRPGLPEDYIKTASPTEWRGLEESAAAWDTFLSQVFDEDGELVDYAQRLFGSAIIGQAVEHIYPIFWGRGRNGKSTLFETLAYVMGDLAGPIEAEMLLDQGRNRKSGGPTSDIMWLRGKRIVWASETGEGRRLNSGKLKWLTGGDMLTGRAPYGRRQVSFKPTHHVFLLTNSKPQAPASDYALWQRLHLIPFQLSFVTNPLKDHERRADPNLIENLKGEASGILAWLIRGCLKWQEEGLNPPNTVRCATEQYRDEEDLIGLFVKEKCNIDDDERVRAGSLYDEYKSWCEENGLTALSNPKFAEQMLERFERKKLSRHRFYLGRSLR